MAPEAADDILPLAQETGTAVTCVITETSNPKHVIDNLGAGYCRLPDPDQTQRMERVVRGFMQY